LWQEHWHLELKQLVEVELLQMQQQVLQQASQNVHHHHHQMELVEVLELHLKLLDMQQ
jgi:hypothetical protein